MSSEKHSQDVRIATDKGRLRLQFSGRISRQFWGKRQVYKSVKRLDSHENRVLLQRVCERIQADIDHPDCLFDPTLQKYLMIERDFFDLLPTLGELWENYCNWKLSTNQISQTTYKTRHNRTFKNLLHPWLKEIVTPEIVEQIIVDIVSSDCYKPTVKKLFSALNEMGERCIRLGKLSKNYFAEMKEVRLKIPKKSKQLEAEINYKAFTVEERDCIIQAFRQSNNPNEQYIADLIEFLFLTGCRLGEAFALPWGNIKPDYIIFDRSYSTECKLTKSTKTETIRIFKTKGYQKLQQLIENLKSKYRSVNAKDLVFLDSNGKQYDRLKLSALWLGQEKEIGEYKHKGVVIRLVESGDIKQYLKPSSTRHTFISLQINAGCDIKILADSCGNSVNTIYRHYLEVDRGAVFNNI